MSKNIIVLGDSFTFGHGCSDRVFYWDPDTKKYVGNDKSLALGPSEHCWASLISQHYPGTKVTNISSPGKDNTSCFIDFLVDYIDNKTADAVDMVIFAMTFDDRIQIASPAGFEDAGFQQRTQGRPVDHFKDYMPMSSWSPLWSLESWSKARENPAEYNRALEYYTNYLYNPAWGAKLGHLALYGMQGLIHSIGAKFYWSAPGAASVNKSKYLVNNVKSQEIAHIIDHLEIFDRSNVEAAQYRCPDGHANDAGHKKYFAEVIQPIVERA